jgi:hypothetical protein
MNWDPPTENPQARTLGAFEGDASVVVLGEPLVAASHCFGFAGQAHGVVLASAGPKSGHGESAD